MSLIRRYYERARKEFQLNDIETLCNGTNDSPTTLVVKGIFKFHNEIQNCLKTIMEIQPDQQSVSNNDHVESNQNRLENLSSTLLAVVKTHDMK